MDALGWQTLLAAELPPLRSRDLVRELGSSSASVPADWIKNHRSLSKAERQRISYATEDALHEGLKRGVRIVEWPEFPANLQEAKFTPPAVFCWGDWGVVQAPCIAIVGTRAATTYGKAVAMKFAEAFARAGVTVVSGGALGIDAAAHKGALSASGKTVAVLAGGLDKPYPASHRGLFDQIRASGCLVSQFPLGSNPQAYRFLVRNTLVAALCTAVLVVEAPAKSGALTTAHAANDMGRQVFVVPANIENLNFTGSHALIRDGASLVDHPDQVLEALNIRPVAASVAKNVASSVGQRILNVLDVTPLAAEFIAERSKLDPSIVLSELTMLELEGRVVRDTGGYALLP